MGRGGATRIAGGETETGEGQAGLPALSLGGTLSSLQARVAVKKVVSFGGDLTTRLWVFSFMIMPSSRGRPGGRDENTDKHKRTRQLTARGGVGAAGLSRGESTSRVPPPQSLSPPIHSGTSGLCQFPSSLLSSTWSWPHSPRRCTKGNAFARKRIAWLVPGEKPPIRLSFS